MKEIFVLRGRGDRDTHNKSLKISGLQSVMLYYAIYAKITQFYSKIITPLKKNQNTNIYC